MTATQAPTPGPLSGFQKGDVVRQLDWNAITTVDDVSDQGAHVGVTLDGKYGVWPASRFTFIGRPDESGWMPWSGGENPVPGQRVEVRYRDGGVSAEPFASDGEFWQHSFDNREARATDIIAFRLAPTAPVEASGSEREDEDAIDVEDMEWPESPLANDLYQHIQSQFCLHPDEAAEETGEVLSILAKHGVDPTKLPLNLTTPARAEAQDEGAAGPWGWVIGNRRDGKKWFSQDHTAVDAWVSDPDFFEVTPVYCAHPSPTPAADADRVRIAVEAIWEIAGGRAADGHNEAGRLARIKDRAAEALAALKSTAAKEGGE